MHKIVLVQQVGTNENNMKIRVWTIIRKARNHCQDVDNWDQSARTTPMIFRILFN